MKTETALVTGSKGFIGRYLVDELKHRGVRVQTADRELFSDKDWRSRLSQPDVIYNLAASGSKKGNYTREEIFNTNLKQAWELMEWQHGGIFVQVGTSSEYGKQDTAMNEDMKLKPDFLYAATKAAATQLVREHSITNRARAMVLRPFTIYGVGMQETKLLPVAIRNIKGGVPVRLVDGEHDYLHVRDLVQGMIDLPQQDQVWEDGLFHEFNLGSGIPTTNLEVVYMIGEIIKCEPIIERISELPDHVHHSVDSKFWRADLERVTQYGWRPSTSLYYGLSEMIYG